MAMLLFRFYYFVGGFYDRYLTFEKVVNTEDKQSLFITAECPLGVRLRHFINVSSGSLILRDSDLKIIIDKRIDYCQRLI